MKIDAEDAFWLRFYRWSNVNGYLGTNSQARRTVYLHRVIMDAPKGFDVDHINGDRSDNRRCNLRIVTRSQNMQNRLGPMRGTKSGIRGVSWSKRQKKWLACVTINRKIHRLGCFEDMQQAGEVAKAFRIANMTHTREQ